nr:DUF3533 domain-containing protein [Streptomyces durbertensis]
MASDRAHAGRRGITKDLVTAVTPRAVLLILGVLALQLAFIASYVGAFHKPSPHRVPIAVVAPEQAGAELARQLDALDGDPVEVKRTVTDRATGERLVRDREVDAAFVADPAGDTDDLVVATGAGASLAQALEGVFTQVQEGRQRNLETVDLVPATRGDARGLTSFYLVVGWCVGGYLCAAIMAMSYGARPSNMTRALIRIVALALYSVAAGAGGAALVGPVLDALPGSSFELAALGALVVFAVGAATLALQALAGVVGIGLAILLIVVLGNPSAGGAYAGPLLPTFWREIGPALPPGAGTWAARSIAYFDGAAVTMPLVVLGGWAVAGVALTLLFALRHRRRPGAHRAVDASAGATAAEWDDGTDDTAAPRAGETGTPTAAPTEPTDDNGSHAHARAADDNTGTERARGHDNPGTRPGTAPAAGPATSGPAASGTTASGATASGTTADDESDYATDFEDYDDVEDVRVYQEGERPPRVPDERGDTERRAPHDREHPDEERPDEGNGGAAPSERR